MSIASEFDSTIENIKSDYEGLENIGADLTNVNKNIQNIRTCLDNIYTNLPKTTGEGSNLSLSTLKGRINVDDILGDTQQDTYEGYNLLPSINTTRTINGVTFTHNADGSITANGTSTDIALYRINVNSETGTRNVSIPAGNWYCTDGVGDYTNYFTQCTNGTAYMNTGSGSSGVLGKSNMVTTTETSTFQAHIYIRSGVTINNVTFKPMIVSSANVDKPYEQYTGGTASPNPTYPQEINVVTGTQEVVVQNKNLANNNTLVNGYMDATGIWVTSTDFRSTDYIEVVEGQTYTSSMFDNSGTRLTSLVFATFDSNKNLIEQKTQATLTIASGVKYIRCRNYQGQSSYIINNDFKYQVELGSTATSYVEHQEQTKTLHLSSRNLCFTDVSEWTIGQYDQNGNIDNNATPRVRLKNYLPVPENEVLYLNTNLTNYTFLIRAYDKNKTYLGSLGAITNGGTITTTSISNVGIAYLGTNIYKSNGETSTTGQDILDKITSGNIKPFICLNTETDKTYEPYYYYELSKIGTYQDRIFESSGKQMLNVTATSQTKNNIVFTIDNGVVKANGTGNSSTGLVLGQVQLEAGKTYYLSGCASGGGSGKYTLSITAENDTTRLAEDTGSGASYTPSTSGTYDIRLNYWYNYAISNLTFYPMVSTDNSSFEPYGSDKWYIEKNTKKIDITGSETSWERRDTGTSGKYRFRITLGDNLPNTANNVTIPLYCTKLKEESPNESYLCTQGIAIDTSTNGFAWFYIEDISSYTAANFKTWLASNNIELRYILATPTYEEITNETLQNELNEIEKMMSYNGQTNISVSGNLPMILDISALKGE